MKYKIVSIRDDAVQAFGQPMFMVALGQATRGFADEVNNESGPMGKHPSDYSLYELGSYDDETGKFENLESPRLLSRGADVSKAGVTVAPVRRLAS